MKRAFFVIGPEGSGTYMLAEAFVSAGCTYCDKDDIHEFLRDRTTPELLVVRRSLPHAGEWPDILRLKASVQSWGYKTTIVTIVRDQAASEVSVSNRKPSETYVPNSTFGKALRFISDWIEHGALFVSYEYFVISPSYRNSLFDRLDLPSPQMEFYDGNAKYYE